MSNLEKATKAYNKIMWDLGEFNKLAEDLIYQGVLKGDYDVADLVNVVQGYLNEFETVGSERYAERFSKDYFERTEAEAEMKKYKYFIKKWTNVKGE